MRFNAKLNGHDIEGDCVNPGEWFGKAWVVEVESMFLAVEADYESVLIDWICNSDKYGKSIRVDDDSEVDDDTPRAGNAGEPINLDNVAFYGRQVSRMDDSIPFHAMPGCSDLRYLTDDGREVSPIEFAKDPDGLNCPKCGEERSPDCSGRLRCSDCDGPCPQCDDGGGPV